MKRALICALLFTAAAPARSDEAYDRYIKEQAAAKADAAARAAGRPTPAEQSELNRQLYIAAVRKDVAAMKALLARGADPNTRIPSDDGLGSTMLHHAVETDNLAMVQAVLSHNPDLEAQIGGNLGATALWRAASDGKTEILKLLLEKGADVEAIPSGGLSIRPLMMAAYNGHLPAVKLLLKYGADAEMRVKQAIKEKAEDVGFNALDYAHLAKHRDIEKVLKAHMAAKKQD